ncbi:MAG: hypothetical protein ABL934_03605 [Lysobacteraceae bacterium]
MLVIRAIPLLICMMFAGCTVKVNNVRVDTAKLDARGTATLRCGYRLHSIIDQRPSGDRAGTLGVNLLTVENAPDTLRSQLLQAGLADVAGEGTPVSIELMRLYMNQNLYTMLPTVVYRAKVGDGQPFIIRSQLGSMSWSGSKESVYEGYSTAMRDANGRLIGELNARCL